MTQEAQEWQDELADIVSDSLDIDWNANICAGHLLANGVLPPSVIAELKQYVIAFGAAWAVQYSRDFSLPEGHLHPTHYDILEKCGARMDDFTRAKLEASK